MVNPFAWFAAAPPPAQGFLASAITAVTAVVPGGVFVLGTVAVVVGVGAGLAGFLIGRNSLQQPHTHRQEEFRPPPPRQHPCIVCLENLNGETVQCPDCQLTFHRRCIPDEMGLPRRCPECQAVFPTAEPS